ncbi:hypothetical protein BD769DRAFT_1384086 [Suillus cothurnatus]|nr:hypothetical protein BD769DRAFT_1384086 [Suillus cothurnatus]
MNLIQIIHVTVHSQRTKTKVILVPCPNEFSAGKVHSFEAVSGIFRQTKDYVPVDDTEGNMSLTERDPGVKVMGRHDIRRAQVIQEFVFVFCCSWAGAIGQELPNNVPYQAKVAPSAGIHNVLDQVIYTHFGRFKVLEEYFGLISPKMLSKQP